MPRGVLKENLPSKVCASCERPFTWRKKWERCWDEVTTCSKSCNAKRREAGKPPRFAKTGPPPPPPRANDDDDAVLTALMIKGLPMTASPAALVEDEDENEDDGVCVNGPMSAAASTPIPWALAALNDQAALVSDDDDDDDDESSTGADKLPVDSREWRKAQRKVAKAQQRARREGTGDKDVGRKSCDLCCRRVDLLVRCTIDASQKWRMVCGQCWKDVSGGVTDGDAAHPDYKYGGLWKNRSRSVT